VSTEHLDVGFHYDVPASVYHADPCPEPSLSSGIARTLITQSPAHAHLEHVRLGGVKTDPTAEMIFGGYVHGLMAGDTSDFEVGNFDNFTTTAAKKWRDGIKATGKTPILEHAADRARLVESAIRSKAFRGLSRNPLDAGKHEVTAIWKEENAWLRARYDVLDMDPNGFADVWDWKTTEDVSTDAVIRKIIDKGYHIQAAHYLLGINRLAPEYRGRTSFVFVFVETKPPFAVRRFCLRESFASLGRVLSGDSIDLWRQCISTGKWPEHGADTIPLEAPSWYSMRILEGAA
jgi:hypothetical protein